MTDDERKYADERERFEEQQRMNDARKGGVGSVQWTPDETAYEADREADEGAKDAGTTAARKAEEAKTYSAKQQALIDFADKPGASVLAFGSIRSGKTYAALKGFFNYIAHEDRRGKLHLICSQNVYVIRNDILARLNELAATRGWIAALNQRTYELYIGYRRGQTDYVDFKQRHIKIQCVAGVEEDTHTRIMGLTCHSCYFDEVVHVDKSFFQHARGRLSYPDSKTFLCTNPAGSAHWLKTDYIDRGAFSEVYAFTFEDNPWLSDEYKAEQLINFPAGTPEHKRYVLGEWAVAEGVIFRSFSTVDLAEQLGGAYNPNRPFDTWVRLWIGHDHGVTDPTVFTPIAEIYPTSVKFEVGEEDRTGMARYVILPSLKIEGAASDQEVLMRYFEWHRDTHGTQTPVTFVRDPAPVAANFWRLLRQHALRHRFRSFRLTSADYPSVVAALFGTTSRKTLVPSIQNLNGLFARRDVVVDVRCKDLLVEMDNYVWDTDAPDDMPKDGDDHHIESVLRPATKLQTRTAGRLNDHGREQTLVRQRAMQRLRRDGYTDAQARQNLHRKAG